MPNTTQRCCFSPGWLMEVQAFNFDSTVVGFNSSACRCLLGISFIVCHVYNIVVIFGEFTHPAEVEFVR